MPKFRPLPPLERLNELLEVVEIPEDKFGEWSGLVCKINRKGTRGIGSVAGGLQRHNLVEGRCDWTIAIDKRRYLVARVIYYMVNTVDPGCFEVDHKDRNTLNNNRENLRLADRSLQGHNMIKRTKVVDGVLGVDFHRKSNLWRVRIRDKGPSKSLGYFKCKVKAGKVYNEKAIELGFDKIGKPLNDLETIKCDCGSCVSRRTAKRFTHDSDV